MNSEWKKVLEMKAYKTHSKPRNFKHLSCKVKKIENEIANRNSNQILKSELKKQFQFNNYSLKRKLLKLIDKLNKVFSKRFFGPYRGRWKNLLLIVDPK